MRRIFPQDRCKVLVFEQDEKFGNTIARTINDTGIFWCIWVKNMTEFEQRLKQLPYFAGIIIDCDDLSIGVIKRIISGIRHHNKDTSHILIGLNSANNLEVIAKKHKKVYSLDRNSAKFQWFMTLLECRYINTK